MTAKPSFGGAVSEAHVGAASAEAFGAAMIALGVRVSDDGGATHRDGEGVSVGAPYRRVLTPAAHDEETGAITAPAVLGTGLSYVLAVQTDWISAMASSGETLTTTPDALTHHIQSTGSATTIDGAAAWFAPGTGEAVWLFAAPPPGARRLFQKE